MFAYFFAQNIVQQKTARLDDAHTQELTKDTVELDNYLLNQSYQGIFWLNVPLKSTRLKLMMPNSIVSEGTVHTNLTSYFYGLMQAVKERRVDLTITGFVELAGVMVAFQSFEGGICWRFCSFEKGGKDSLFGSLVGEYIDAVNQQTIMKARVFRLLLVLQGLRGSFATAEKERASVHSGYVGFITPIGSG